MTKQVYLTLYKALKTQTNYGSYVLATSEEEALEKIAIRNIGEVLEDALPFPVSRYTLINALALYDQQQFKSCLHAVIFMSYVLGCAGKIDTLNLLSDQGLVHELLHVLSSNYDMTSNFVLKTLREDVVAFQQLFDEITH